MMAAGGVGILLSGCQQMLWWRRQPEAVTAVDRPSSPPLNPNSILSPSARAASKRPELGGKPAGVAEAPPQTLAQQQPKVPVTELPPAKKFTYPVAFAVPGRDDVVLSPFNQKLVDVAGFKSGALVADPHYPLSEKKFFRVP